MRRIIIRILISVRRVREYFLLQGLKGSFIWIGGYRKRMVRANGRYFEKWEVKFVKRLMQKGRIEFSHKSSITSTATGFVYTDDYYILRK